MGWRIRASAAAAALIALFGVAGCNGSNGSTVAQKNYLVDINAFVESDVAFFERLRPAGAVLIRPPVSLREARDKSTVVVAAQVVDVQPGRVIRGASLLAVKLDVVDVVSGKLRDAGTDSLQVEMLSTGSAPLEERAAALRKDLPEGVSIWFLRWRGEVDPLTKPLPPGADPGATAAAANADPQMYSLKHMFTVFIQGAERVLAPTVDADEAGLATGCHVEAARNRYLSDLVATIQRD